MCHGITDKPQKDQGLNAGVKLRGAVFPAAIMQPIWHRPGRNTAPDRGAAWPCKINAGMGVKSGRLTKPTWSRVQVDPGIGKYLHAGDL